MRPLHLDRFVRQTVLLSLLAAFFVTLSAGSSLGQTLTTLYDFGAQQHDGGDPQSGVVLDENGNLFGASSIGARSSSDGNLFELVRPEHDGDPWTEIIGTQFRDQNGRFPEGRILRTPAGRIFGTTFIGGTHDQGTVYMAVPPPTTGKKWRLSILHNFGDFPGDGINPNQGLLAVGKSFYGVTMVGGEANTGTIFRLSPPSAPGSAWTETILYSFQGSTDAAFPSSELIMDAQGNLYGTALQGGDFNSGAVFQLVPPKSPGDPWTEIVIHSFSGPDGSSPFGRLLLNADGSLYGTTTGGGTGSGQGGVVFLLTPRRGGEWEFATIFNFSGGSPDGASPFAGVISDPQGNLYGTAAHGGDGGGGVVFKLTKSGSGEWVQTILHAFSGTDGFAPNSQLTPGKGVFYGTTSLGGRFGSGTVFSLPRQ